MSALDIGARGLAKRSIDTQRLPDRAALQRALAHAPEGASLFLAEPGHEGRFTVWGADAFFARFAFSVTDAKAADPLQGIFVATDDGAKVARRVIGNGLWLASWFGWTRAEDGGDGATNRDALRAIEALINYSAADEYRPFANGANVNQIVDLGFGEYDLGAEGDTYGLRRVRGNYQGRGYAQTQINWKGDAGASVIQWDATFRGFFRNCRLGGEPWVPDNPPKHWIDTTYDSGLGRMRLMDWSDNFDNFYCDVSSDPDAAAVVLCEVVNFTFENVRFAGGTRHVYVYQGAGASCQRGLRILNYTFDFSNCPDGVFREHICVDITSTGSLAITLAPTRCEGNSQPAENAAIVRVTDTQGPNAIGLHAVTLTIEGGAGWQFSHPASAAWVVYQDTTQTNCYTPIHIPNGGFFNGFQGMAGGNWTTFISRFDPAFSTFTLLAPFSNDPRSDNYLGTSARTSGPIYFGSGTAAQVGAILTNGGNPEGRKAANPGSICLSPASVAGFTTYRKNSGTGNTGWVNISQTKGALNATTDASGDLTVSHGFGSAPSKVIARIDGPALYHTAIHTIGNSTFKVRVFDPSGVPQGSTALTGWWEAETTS